MYNYMNIFSYFIIFCCYLIIIILLLLLLLLLFHYYNYHFIVMENKNVLYKNEIEDLLMEEEEVLSTVCESNCED